MSARPFADFDPDLLLDGLAVEGTPLPAGLARLLRLAWQASLLTDEGRPPRFVVALSDRSARRRPAKSLAEPFGIEGRPDRLARLAIATSPDWSCIEIAEDGGGELCAWGISPVPESPGEAQDDDAPCILVEVLDPGCLRVESEAGVSAFQRGRLLTSRTTARLSECLPDGAAATLASRLAEPAGGELRMGLRALRVDDATWSGHGPLLASEARANAPGFLAKGLRMVLRAVRRRGHGGSLLLLPSGGSLAEAARAGLVSPRWAFGEPEKVPASAGLLEHAGWYLHWSLALEGVSVIAELRKLDDARRERTCRARMNAGLRLLEAEAQRAAQLAQVDGAVACSALLEPLAMGVLLAVSSGGSPTPTPTRGARHASLASATSALAGSVGIAISHDGDATLFRAIGGRAEQVELLP